MKPLLGTLANSGAEITYLEKEGFLPIKLQGNYLVGGKIDLLAEQSSQYFSALLLSGNLFKSQ